MNGRNRICFAMSAIALAGLCVLSAARAATSDTVATSWEVGLDTERWQLPADETAGVAGLHLRRNFGEHLRLGVDSFAAVQGRRGGFITLGVGGEYVYPLTRHVDVEGGFSVSAGGGRGGHELSGGGLLLRESIGLGLPLGAWRWRAGISHIDFPNGGSITGTQWYAGLEHSFRGLSVDPSDTSDRFRLTETSAFTPSDLGVYGRQYRVRHGSVTEAGRPQANFGVVGAQWRGTISGPWYYMVDAAGAAHGSSNGYMEIMGGVGLRLPLTSTWSLDAGVSLGAGGGGAVSTGGGMLVAARVGAEWSFSPQNVLAVGVERLKAPNGHLDTDGVSITLRRRFGPDHITTVDAGDVAALDTHPVRVRVTEQSYRAAGAAWSTRPIPNIGVLGVQADYDLNDLWYMTGQGLAAYRGQSGAYMTGLVGAGLHLGMSSGLRVEAEALAGAAGGGGVAVASGAVGQVNVGLGYEWRNGVGVHATIGRIRSLHGTFAANVAGLSISYRTKLLSGSS